MDARNIILILVSIADLFLGLISYFNRTAGGEKNARLSTTFTLLAFNVAAWSIAIVPYRFTDNLDLAHFYLRILYTIPLFIPVFFLYFSINLVDAKIVAHRQILKWIFTIETVLMSTLVLFTGIFLQGVGIPPVGEKIIYFGPWYFIYSLHYVIFFGAGSLYLIHEFFTHKDKEIRSKVLYVFLGTFVSSFIGMFTNLILPWFGYFTLNWLGNVMTIVFAGFLMYAIYKYKIFTLKIIATELFALILMVGLLIELFLVESAMELFVKTSVLILVAILSFLLINSVYREVETREKIELLAKDLEKANTRLKELDVMKSEFLSFASHQLRSPLTAVKGYVSMILENSFGEVPKEQREPLNRVFTSTENLVKVVNEFLDVSRIEQGRMKYEMASFDLGKLVAEVVNEFKPNVEKANLSITLPVPPKEAYFMVGDRVKIKQVIGNIIDNAIKYTPKGGITVGLTRSGKKGIISVKDTGVGIPKDDLKKMFNKFTRAKDANKTDVTGTGLGMYLAKSMTEAHKGRISVESEGKDKGTTFFVELPIS